MTPRSPASIVTLLLRAAVLACAAAAGARVQAQAADLTGTYDGLATVFGNGIGTFTAVVKSNGDFAADLKTPSVEYMFKQAFVNGSCIQLVNDGAAQLDVQIQIDGGTGVISGFIYDFSETYDLTATREAAMPALAGHYTVLIPPPADTTKPQGIGNGKLTISKKGVVKFVGVLGDGTPVNITAHTHIDGSFTLFAPLYTFLDQGVIAGQITVESPAVDSDLSGNLDWIRTGDNTYLTFVSFNAALYAAPKGAQQALSFTDTTSGAGTFTLAGGELDAPIVHSVTVSNKNVVKVTDPGPDALTVKIKKASGKLTGTFIHPLTGKKTTFTGYLQQKLNSGGAVFTGPDPGAGQGGSAALAPQ